MAEFGVWQEEAMVASVSCKDRNIAIIEIMHYAMIYLQDGPIEIRELKEDEENAST